jgi:hypothetical protein
MPRIIDPGLPKSEREDTGVEQPAKGEICPVCGAPLKNKCCTACGKQVDVCDIE